MKSEKGLSSVYRMVNASKEGFLSRAHGHGKPLLGFLVLFSLLAMSVLPVVQADNNYHPTGETVWFGSRNGVYPHCVRAIDEFGCQWIEGVGDTVDFVLEWASIPLTNLRLDMRLQWSEVAGTDGIGIRYYNATIPGWTHFYTIDDDESTFTNLSFDVTGNMYNGSAPSIRFTGDSLGGGNSLAVSIDYIAFIDEFKELEDDLRREIEELRKKLDDVHPGEIIDPTEKLLPYPPGTREGLDADYYLLGDPYRELFFNSYSNPDAASSVTLPILYDTSWSDVDMLTDQIWIGDFSGTLFINDTTDSTKILQTTQSYSHFLVNATSEGHALTAEVTSGSVKVSRMARTHATFTFDWYIDPHTYEHRTVFSVDNDLTENWREIVIVVAGNPDYTIDSSSVEVWDLDNNVELTTKNYEMTSTSFRMGLTWLNASTSRSFKILYSPYQEGSSYQEPMGVFRYDVSSSATLNNRVFLFDSVTISNPNSIDCDVGTRITIQMSSIPGNINEIFVITDGGSYLTQGPPLGNKWYTFYGLEIPANSVVTVSVYVKAPEPTLSPGWFQLHGLWIFALFFIMLIISFLGWMWAVTVKDMKKYAGPIAAFFWFNVLMTMLFGVLTFLAGG